MADLKEKVILITGGGRHWRAVVAAIRQAGGTAIATISPPAGRRRQARCHRGSDCSASPPRSKQAWPARRTGERRRIAAVASIEKTDFATWRRVLSINLDGTFLGCKYGVSAVRKQGGAIVNLSSV